MEVGKKIIFYNTGIAALLEHNENMLEKMVKQYRQEGWGIYDDSSDMDRTVILSDAYMEMQVVW